MKCNRTPVVVLFVSACGCVAASTDLLRNGDFEAGTEGWQLFSDRPRGASATLAADESAGGRGQRAARITVESPARPNDVQFTGTFATSLLEPGEVYVLSFLTKADQDRTYSVHLIGARKPWGNAGLSRTVTLGQSWQPVRVLFRARPPEQESVKIDFFLGAQKGSVWIDDVVLARHATTGPAQFEVGATLSQGTSRIELTRGGAVGRVVHAPTGRAVAGGAEPPPCFELTVREAGKQVTLSSSDAAELASTAGADGCEHTYVYPDLSVRCTVAQMPGTSLFAFGLAIENRGERAVTGVDFPIIHCPAKLGEESGNDAILYPRCDGGLVENPFAAMGGQVLRDTYPGPLSCQLMAYYDTTAGLTIAAYDSAGHPKRFECSMGVDLRLSISHLLPNVPGKDVRLPYRVVAGAFTGDWYAAAELYRTWALKQPWCRETLLERNDTPRWVWKGGLVTLFNPRAKTAEGLARFRPAGLRIYVKELAADFGLPVVPNNRGWERYGEWCGQEYLPPFPDAATFRAQAAVVRECGGQGMIMLSGYRWTIDKPQPDGSVHSNQERFDRDVHRFVTHDADGRAPLTWTSEKKNDWHGTKYARLCPATAFAQDTITAAAVACVESGYPIIHFDQEVGGPAASSFCGSTGHGHEPGYGRWMHEAMASLFTRIRRECGPLDAGFALSIEEPNELYIPWLNLCQSRPNGLTNQFPMRKPLTRVVPLFSYLYHDFLVGWIAFYPWRSQGHGPYSLAKGFAAGMMPGLHRESMSRWPEVAQQAFKRMLRNCCRVYAGDGRDYLLFGRMLRPLTLNVPVRELNLGERFGSIRVPAVTNSVWELADGRKAAILFNPEKQDWALEVPGAEDEVTVPALGAMVVLLGAAEE